MSINMKKILSKNTGADIVKYGICILFTILVMVPVLLAVMAGFKSAGQVQIDPVGWPKPFLWENYVDVVATSSFLRYFFNSILITFLTVFFTVIVTACSGFVLSKFRFRGKEVVYNFLFNKKL